MDVKKLIAKRVLAGSSLGKSPSNAIAIVASPIRSRSLASPRYSAISWNIFRSLCNSSSNILLHKAWQHRYSFNRKRFWSTKSERRILSNQFWFAFGNTKKVLLFDHHKTVDSVILDNTGISSKNMKTSLVILGLVLIFASTEVIAPPGSGNFGFLIVICFRALIFAKSAWATRTAEMSWVVQPVRDVHRGQGVQFWPASSEIRGRDQLLFLDLQEDQPLLEARGDLQPHLANKFFLHWGKSNLVYIYLWINAYLHENFDENPRRARRFLFV